MQKDLCCCHQGSSMEFHSSISNLPPLPPVDLSLSDPLSIVVVGVFSSSVVRHSSSTCSVALVFIIYLFVSNSADQASNTLHFVQLLCEWEHGIPNFPYTLQFQEFSTTCLRSGLSTQEFVNMNGTWFVLFSFDNCEWSDLWYGGSEAKHISKSLET